MFMCPYRFEVGFIGFIVAPLGLVLKAIVGLELHQCSIKLRLSGVKHYLSGVKLWLFGVELCLFCVKLCLFNKRASLKSCTILEAL